MLDNKSPCPRCEAPQKFALQYKSINDDEIEVYIRCTTCRWEQVIRKSNIEIEKLLKLQVQAKAKAIVETARHGQPSGSTIKKMERLALEIATARRLMENDGGS